MNEYFIKSKLGKINIIEGKEVTNFKAIILHVHGVGSHFQFVYPNLDELITRDDFFSKFGYKSFGFEFYGHGKSEGLNCSIKNFSDLVTDLANVVTHIDSKYPDKSIFICAESMGGAVCLKYIIEKLYLNCIKGFILLSPLCGIDNRFIPNPVMIQVLLGITNVLPNLQLALTTKKMSSETTVNTDFIMAKNLCPYGFRGPHRLCTVRELFKISLWIPDNVHDIKLPLILFHGLRDKITTPSSSINVFEKIKSTDKEIVILPESEHCVLVPNSHDDLTPNFIYIKILDWLERHI
jgi:alpha-beta hydrolase superfamily lysophospholipase